MKIGFTMQKILKRVLIKLKVLKHPLLRKYKKIDGHLTEYEGLTLYQCAKKTGQCSLIVEIGSFHGKSANYICAAIKNKEESKLYCVDIWEKTNTPGSVSNDEEFFINNTKMFNDLIIRFKGNSNQFKSSFNESIDMIFIDADHSYESVINDINNLIHLVKTNSFLLFHDYTHPCGVKKAVDETISRGIIKKIEIRDSICVCQKI
ncbi:MAG: class I SAM-dependent methyltransferase [Bacteroidales bacterium]|nr:class I SAM-dependent methyltransferase [Bacteroidales bacterium]